jgi:hypothetical protein
MRKLAANNMRKLVNKQKQNRNKNEYLEWRTIKNIKQKLINNQAIIMKADKGNTLIIIMKLKAS